LKRLDAIAEEQVRLREDFNKLREEQIMLREDFNRLREDFNKMFMAFDVRLSRLREHSRNLHSMLRMRARDYTRHC
jgi:predicted  nucleic acid-binding Zn-ribbon protein